MTTEPRHVGFGTPMSEWIACTPGDLNDLPVGMWEIVNDGRRGFGLEGPALADFVRRSIYALIYMLRRRAFPGCFNPTAEVLFWAVARPRRSP